MITKTVYLHENGNLVIWGRSEFFEPSPLVQKTFQIEKMVADSKDFKEMVLLFNEKNIKLKQTKERLNATKQRLAETENEYENKLNEIKRYVENIGFFQKKHKKRLLNILAEPKTIESR